jgi:transcriptional regulator with XRE-family HTH domain
MSRDGEFATVLAAALRRARRARKVSIADLAAQAGVSPRLISEFELGKRPHVSLATAMRLLDLVGLRVRVDAASAAVAEHVAMAERAERRRQSWVWQKSTLREQTDPEPADSYADRLAAVAQASRLAIGLQQAPRVVREGHGGKEAP